MTDEHDIDFDLDDPFGDLDKGGMDDSYVAPPKSRKSEEDVIQDLKNDLAVFMANYKAEKKKKIAEINRRESKFLKSKTRKQQQLKKNEIATSAIRKKIIEKLDRRDSEDSVF